MFLAHSGSSASRRTGQYHRHSDPHLLIAALIFLASASGLRAQSGLLEARIVEGDGQVSTPGNRLSRPLVVEVTDETGIRVEDAIVSFRLPEDGITGTFRNGLKTEILRTDSEGHAAMRSLVAGGLAGQFQVRLTVAKGAARTGVLSNQFIAPPRDRHLGPLAAILHPHGRVLEIGALVLAVAVAGYVKEVGFSGSSHSIQQPPVIGPPSVTVGRP